MGRRHRDGIIGHLMIGPLKQNQVTTPAVLGKEETTTEHSTQISEKE